MQAPSISIKQATLAFRDVVLFHDLHLTLAAGRCTCLLGPSGIGKSTLLRLIAGLLTPETVAQEKTRIVAEVHSDNPAPLSTQMAYMAQQDLLLPWLTVLDNVLLGAHLRHDLTLDRRQAALTLLKRMGLDHAQRFYPRQLSGGMRQRVALARTLIEDKPVILMDEPFTALDTITRFKLQTLAAELLKDKTVLLVTHDPLEALRLADDIYIMSGQPVTLHAPLALTTPTPRDPADPAVLMLQAKLLHALTDAYEGMT